MRSITATPLIALLLIAPANVAARAVEQWFSIKSDREFSDVRAQLQVVVDHDATQAINQFCVVGHQLGKYKDASVYWPTNNKLILWEIQPDNPRAIWESRRSLDLMKDVVSGNDVHGSTYMITRTYANHVIKSCREHGNNFTVIRTPKGGHNG